MSCQRHGKKHFDDVAVCIYFLYRGLHVGILILLLSFLLKHRGVDTMDGIAYHPVSFYFAG